MKRNAGYSLPSILLHWLAFGLLAAAYATIELREAFPAGSAARETLKAWHFGLGLTVFGLVGLRLLARLIFPPPPLDPPLPRWQAVLAGAVHLALYAFMVAMPLLGWLLLSAEGRPILWLGLELPALTAPSERLAHVVEELHETIGKAGWGLIGLHAAAALYHHYVLRDATMARMLPRRLEA